MNTTEGLTPLCRILRISPCRVAIELRFTENVKAGMEWPILGAWRDAPFGEEWRNWHSGMAETANPDVLVAAPTKYCETLQS